MDRTLSGKRIKLIRMEDPYTNLKEGDEGTIQFIDGIGQIHVKWDSGSSLAIVPEIDEYEIENESKSNKLKYVRMFEEFISGSDLGYVNVKMEELSDLVQSSDDENTFFNWKVTNNKLSANLKTSSGESIFYFDLNTMTLNRNIKGEQIVDRVSSSEEAMDIIEDCIYDCLGISEARKVPKKYLTHKPKAMKKEIETFIGKKEYKKDWEADYDKRSGKRIKTKKSAATKAYQKMFGKKD